MVDDCVIEVGVGAGTQNETTGRVVQVWTQAYTGPCRVQAPQAQPQQADVADRAATTQSLTVSIPVSATGIPVGARVRITAAALDAELVDRVFRVTGVHHKTHATARRLQVEEVTA